jgi:RNA polymerase sigma-70 factor, ECF subfamily
MMASARLLDWILPAAAAAEIDWDRVYSEELSRVLNYFRYRVLNPATAEDLTSTTFEKAWRARSRYRRERASVGTWLLAIARNVAADHFRRLRPEVPLEDLPDRPSGEDVDESYQRERDRRRLAALLSSLPERERELLALKYGAGETNRAIARLTGLSESNVGTVLHRTITTLRRRWDAEGGSR